MRLRCNKVEDTPAGRVIGKLGYDGGRRVAFIARNPEISRPYLALKESDVGKRDSDIGGYKRLPLEVAHM